jgi:hypothetical protein
MAITNRADERDPVVTDNMVLSQEGGRWSVSLREDGSRRTPADRAHSKPPPAAAG